MGFPDRKEIDRAIKRLKDSEPTHILPDNASKADQLKYDLCRRFVIHLRKYNMSQLELAKELEIDPARMNEIVKYRVDRFTADKLIEYAERLNPRLKVVVK